MGTELKPATVAQADRFKPNHARECLIRVNARWYIAQLGLVKMNGVVTAVWCTREDGAVICNIGDEERVEMLPDG